uniref:Uncharacterized protein n=1 Tax=Hemiselmis andersenii TaxID=464988 RepID=A0A6T8LRV9_HEMAN|mmetsp:Transcript_10319/g.25120  ORF Transcript_10319/g.25120 Transcript_10319/m.25120 type:complete len:284 (+) Transcript_10319:122-973(+)
MSKAGHTLPPSFPLLPLLLLLLVPPANPLEHWGGEPGEGEIPTCANRSVAVLIPASPFLHHEIKDKMMLNARRILDDNPLFCLQVFIDGGPIDDDDDDTRPLSKISRLRNRMLASLDMSRWDYVLWIDADVVEYPPDLPTQLIMDNPGGITAPVVLIEEPGPLGPNQFYDTTAFTLKGASHLFPDDSSPYVEGRSLLQFPPYVPNATRRLEDVDGAGTVYVVPSSLFRDGSVRYSDDARLTEHWSVIRQAHSRGVPVQVHLGVQVRHANLPNYGESWHENKKG